MLLVLFAAEGFTILSIHQLITVHFFLGMLLIGPVLLKAAAVCYRFVRYYTGAAEYRRKGPPAPLLRVLGPVVLGTSLGVLGTGVMLAVDESAAGPVAVPAQGVLRAVVRRDDDPRAGLRVAAARPDRRRPGRPPGAARTRQILAGLRPAGCCSAALDPGWPGHRADHAAPGRALGRFGHLG